MPQALGIKAQDKAAEDPMDTMVGGLSSHAVGGCWAGRMWCVRVVIKWRAMPGGPSACWEVRGA